MRQKPHRLELHGLGTAAAEAAIRKLISTAQLQGVRRIEVVYGKGVTELAQVAREVLKSHPDVTDIGSLDANAGHGLWARLRLVSVAPDAPSATSAAKTARELLKQAKGIDPKLPPIPPTRGY